MLKDSKHILVMAGGTGGHIYPALAVAEELISRGYRVSWLGSEGGMEQTLVSNDSIECFFLPVTGVRGKGIVTLFKAPLTLFKCIMKARKIIRDTNVELVIGFGGFASGPGGIAAFISGVKLVLHEQNAIPGMTNKVLSKVATLICQAFPNAFSASDKVLTTGNPIRQTIVEQSKSVEQDKTCEALLEKKNNGGKHLNLLIIGGSRGAQVFNQKLPALFANFTKEIKLSVVHQTGSNHSEKVTQLYRELGVKVDYQVKEFIHDMASEYRWADAIVCRAGALTVSEVSAVGLPAIFVPYPFAVDDHQTLNAKFLADNKAAVIVPQNEIDKVLSYLEHWLDDTTELGRMSLNARQQSVLNATDVICDQCELLISREVA